VVYEILDAGALLVGSSTLNNHMLPQIADILTYLKGLSQNLMHSHSDLRLEREEANPSDSRYACPNSGGAGGEPIRVKMSPTSCPRAMLRAGKLTAKKIA